MITQEDSPHQEFCFNHTKFIFYLDNPHPKKSSRPKTTLSNRKKFSENKLQILKKSPSTKNNSQTKTSFPHSRRSAMQSISNRMAQRNLQSQRQTRKKYHSPTKLGIPTLGKVNTQPCSPLAIKPLNLKKLIQKDDQKQRNFHQQVTKTKESEKNDQKEKENSMSIYDILRLFGEHHTLYREGQDFTLPTKVAFCMGQNKTQAHHQVLLQQQKSGLTNSKMKKVSPLKASQLAMVSSRISGQYMDTFHHERAPILNYLRNISSFDKKLYFLYTKSDSQELRDKVKCDPSIKLESEWVKILPYVSMNIYPQPSTKFIAQERCPCQKPLPFVEFLKTLYFLQPDIITRLIQPPVANIYSVWLFDKQKSNYTPIFVDPYFLMHEGRKINSNRAQQSSSHCSTLGYPYMWLPILIKSILKTRLNTEAMAYGSQNMKTIQISQVYHSLTGLTMQQYFPGSDQQINLKKNKYLILDEDGHVYAASKKLQNNVSKIQEWGDLSEQQVLGQQLCGYNYSTGLNKKFSLSHLQTSDCKIFKLPNCITWFNYSIEANNNCLTKYQLQTERNTDLIFQHSHENLIRVYLYQQIQHNEKKTRLILKMQGKFSSQATMKQLQVLKFKIKPGKYKLFVEHGQQKIHMFFNKQDQSTIQQPSGFKNGGQAVSSVRVSIQSSHQVKLGEGQILQRNNNGITEDSHFFYQKH